MSDSLVNGKIITFYSYKGGTGRSMALANVAWILASQGQRVLIVDWDLEAPGLHRYFHPFLLDKDLTSSRGLIDLLWDFVTEAMTPVQPHERERGWHQEHANILRYAIAVRWRFRNEKGRIDLVPAGKQGPSYSSRVNSFNWQNFYERLGGGVFLEAVKEKMRGQYDYILIDSRTGVSDTSGICTVQMPDTLAVFYTANTQSIDGAAAVAASVHEQWIFQRTDQPNTEPRERRMFPVMTRVELGEKDKVDLARTYARSKFDRLLDLSMIVRTEYWAGVETLYVPWYAYEEVLATFGDKPNESNSLLASAEKLTAFLTDGLVSKLDPPEEVDRATVLQQFSRGTISTAMAEQATYDVYVSYSHHDRGWVSGELSPNLQRAGLRAFVDVENLAPGDRWDDALSHALQQSRQFVAVMSPAWTQSKSAQQELRAALDLDRTSIKVIPVLLEPCEVPSALRAIKYADLTDPSNRTETMQFLLRSLGGQSKEVPSQRPRERLAALVDISRIMKYAPSNLIGREAETKLLSDAWDQVVRGETKRPHILTFVALGGEGKTSVVAKWAVDLAFQDWPGCEAVLAWSFYSQGTREQLAASSDLFLNEALTFFGDAAMAASAAGAFDKGRRLAQLAGERRALLILDGLEPLQYAPTSPTPGELKDQGIAALLKGLATNSRGLCVVTTRYSIPDLRAYVGRTVEEKKLARLSTEAGVALLQSFEVKGSLRKTIPSSDGRTLWNEFEKLVEDVKGHALTLNLLGSYLRDAHGGDIRKRDLIRLSEADAEEQGGDAFRVMDEYVATLANVGKTAYDKAQGQRSLALLFLLGLFDRPATAGTLAVLWEGEAIAGLTEPLIGISEAQRNIALQRLEDAKLLTVTREPGSGALVAIDAHPLLREYFGQRLREAQPGAWRAAHRRLYEHLIATTEDKPDATLEDLQPLYQAVVHGCQAGMQQETCDTVYRDRILRRAENYSVNKLGAFSTDLGAVACFFETPWSRASPTITEAAQAWLLNEAAFRLRALGRLTEAIEPMRAALEMSIKQEVWESAAISASNLSELELTLGDVAGAVGDAEQSVTYADRSGDAFDSIYDRTAHADALHQAGRRDEAEARFRETEQMQVERESHYPLLYSLPGFRYCDLLLAAPEREAGKAEGERKNDEGRAWCRTVAERAAQTLKWAEQNHRSLRTIALDHLTLGRAALYATILELRSHQRETAQPSPPSTSKKSQRDFTTEATELDHAVSGLRRAGQQDYLPRGLLTRAWLRSLTGARTGIESAQSDLDEAWEIAARGPMPLFLADIHLYRARLFFREAMYPWESPQHDLAEARRLIFKHGYLRRKEELEDAEAALKHFADASARLE
jgi:Mrp family chromosome partitioning ATPase/tetratricopeptide (TPR) repeat protein